MMDSLLKRIEKNRKAHIRWLAMVLGLSMIVSLGTFAGFRQTAVAKTYTKEVLDCPYTHEGASPVAHVHNDDCYDGDTLVCTLPEREAHTHTEECFAEQRTLTCTLAENPGHQHGKACYMAREENVCGLEENPGHVHNGTCFNDSGVLICTMAEGDGAHTHTADCFTTVYDLICEIPEGEGAHTHTDECYTTERVQVCGQEELPVHVHGAECIRTVEWTEGDEESAAADEQTVNTVPEMPVSDPNADLETAEDWNREFENFELSGNWANDLVLVAATQQGRGESPNNFEAVLNDAGDAWVRHGYTRYGAWYGVPYAEEWSAMFVSFCLRYAGIPVENVPNNPTAALMAESFSKGELFAGRDYVPAVGDLIFFDTVDDEITNIDHMGIVYHVDTENGTINTVEGDRTDAVATFGYTLDDEQIVGYGILPQNPDYVPTEENNVDETDGLIVMTEDTQKKKETTDTIEETVPAVPMPAQSWERTAGGIKVTVDAPEGAFPENTTIAVTPVNGNRLKDTVSDAVNGEVLEVQAVDITFFDANGHEIEPAVPIRVVMTPAATQHAEEKTSVVHVDLSQQTAELVEQAVGTEFDNSEVVFDADAFTIYAIVYTYQVEYEYEVDGKTFTSSMPGAENMSLTQIVQGLGIVDEVEIGTFVSKIASIASSNEEVAVVNENNEIRVLKDGEAKIVITMQDGAKFHIDVKAEGETSTSNETATVSTKGDLYLPADAELKTEVLDEVKSESAIAAVEAQESTLASNAAAAETAYQVFDISLENVEADQYNGFQVEVKLPEGVVGKNFRLYHVHDGKVEELKLDNVDPDGETVLLESVSFVTPSFSEFVLSYTVDFEYVINGKTYRFSINGGESILLSELVEILDILDGTEYFSNGNFIDNVKTVWFSDESLVKVTQVVSDWKLESLQPFDTEESLIITMKNGDVVSVKVTDEQGETSTDLSKFITGVEITNSSGESVIEDGNKIVVSSEKTYNLTFSFQESNDWQLDNDGQLEYPIPEGVSIDNISGTFDITVGNRTITGNTYEINDGKLIIKLNTSHRNFRFLRTATDTKIDLTFNATFDTTKTTIDFGITDQTYGLFGHDESNASVEKTGYYSTDDHKMHYTVAVKSTVGTSSNINVMDALSGTALSNAQIDSVYENDGNNQFVRNLTAGTDYSVHTADSGFDITIPSLSEGHTVYVQYTADVDVNGIENNGNATFSETANTVNITADGDENPDDNTSTHEQKDITFSSISKVSTSTSDIVDSNGDAWNDETSTGQKYRVVSWKVTANPEQLVSLDGSAITDTLLNNNEVEYFGDGIKVTKIIGNNTTTTEVPWSDVGVNDKANGDHWSYTVHDSDNAAYEITYKTLAKVPEGTNTLDVSNRASDKYGDDTAKVTIQPDVVKDVDKSPLEINKYATSVNSETTTWKIAITVPAGYEGQITVNDTLPTKGGYYDTVRSIVVDDYIEGTDYTYDIEHATQHNYVTGEDEVIGDKSFVLSFSNITSSTENRVINITVVLDNNQEWLEASQERDAQGHYIGGWLNDHTNTAEAVDKEGKRTEKSEDTASPKPKSIDKKLPDGGVGTYKTYDENNALTGEYPSFQFQLLLSGVDSDPVDINDYFNTDLFKIYDGEDVNNNYLSYYNLAIEYSDNIWQGYQLAETRATAESTPDGAIFHLSDLPKTEGNRFYGFYRLNYWLIVKPDKYDEFRSFIAQHGKAVGQNGNAGSKMYIFENMAAWDTVSDREHFNYTVNRVFQKTGIDNNDGTYSYTITLNPDKLNINGGANIDMEDVFSGAQVTASTIHIDATNKDGQPVAYRLYNSDAAAADDESFDGIVIIYDGKSDKILTVEIPDETSVVMTYTAASTGDVTINTETGKAAETVTNTANALDYHYTVEFTHEYNVLDKTKQDNDDGTITFNIDFNPSKAKLNGGNDITLTDTYSGNLKIDADGFTVTVCDPDNGEHTKANAILASKRLSGNIYTFTIPDSTHVTITYTGERTYDIDESGRVTASYTNTAEALNIPKVITDTTSTDMLTKTSTDMLTAEESEDYPGYLKFTITFNPIGKTLNDGDDIELKDEYTKLIVNYATVAIDPPKYPAGHPNAGSPIVYDFTGNSGTFQVPDSTPITITYLAIPDYSYGKTVEWTNKVTAARFKEEISEESTRSSSGAGTATNTASLWLLKYETGHMERKLNNVTFNLYIDNGTGGKIPVLKNNGEQLTFTTEHDITMGDGYTRMELSEAKEEFTDGENGFKEDTIYFLTEQGTVDGYYENKTVYNFVYHPRTIIIHNDQTGEDEIVENDPYVKPAYMTGTTIYLFDQEEIVKVTNDKITTDVSIQKYWVNADGSWDWPEDVNTVTMKLQQSRDSGSTWKDISVANNNIPSYYWSDEDEKVVLGADGSEWSDTLEINRNNTKQSWFNLDIGEGIVYRVVETAINDVPIVDGKATVNGKTYEVVGDGMVSNGKTTITNAERTNIQFEKKWQNISGSVTWTVPDMVTYVDFTTDTDHHDTVTATTDTENKSQLFNGAPTAGEDTVTFDFSKLRLIVELKRYTNKGGDKIEVPFNLNDEHEARLAGVKTLYGEENSDWGSPISGHWASEFVETGYWKGEWKNLPMAGLDEDDKAIDYFYEVKEIAVLPSRQVLNDVNNHYIDISNIFTATYSKGADGKMIITNTLKDDDNYYLNVTKNWLDFKEQPTSGETVKFQLIRNGTRTTQAPAGSSDEKTTLTGKTQDGWSKDIAVTNGNLLIDMGHDKKLIVTVSTTNGTVISNLKFLIRNSSWNIVKQYSPTISGTNHVFEIPVKDLPATGTVDFDRMDGSNDYTWNIEYALTDNIDKQEDSFTGQVMMPDPDNAGKYIVDSTGNYEFTIQPEQTISFASLPYHVATSQTMTETYTYTVIETSRGTNWHVVTESGTYNPAPGDGDEGGQNGEITLVNQYNEPQTAKLTVTKTVSGLPESGTTATFEFTITGDGLVANGVVKTLTYPTDFTNGSGEITLTHANGIKPDATYTVTESVSGANITGYTRTTTVESTSFMQSNETAPSGKVKTDSTTGEGSISFANTYEQKTVDISVNKVWAFANGSTITKVEGKDWPQGAATVQVALYSKTGDSTPAPTGKVLNLTAESPYGEFKNLPEYDGENKIEYSVVEAGVTGINSTKFNTVIEGNATKGYTIRNTEKEAGLTIIKAFEGESLTDEEKNAITFTISGSGLKDSTGKNVDSLTKTYADFTDEKWVLTQNDGIVSGKMYTVTETSANVQKYTRVTTVKVNDGESATFTQSDTETDSGNTPTGSIALTGTSGTVTITNKYTKETTEIEGTKTWIDDRTHDDNATQITLVLKRTTKPVTDKSEWVTVEEATPTWTGNTFKYSGLDKYDDSGVEYEYKVEETEVLVTDGDNAVSYKKEINGNNLINTELTSVEATKTWKLSDGTEVNSTIKNASVTFELQKKTGEDTWTKVEQEALTNPITLDVTDTASADAWKATWSELPKYEKSGEEIKQIDYRVVETAASFNAENLLPKGEGTSYPIAEAKESGVLNVDNTLPTTEISVTKQWKDGTTVNADRVFTEAKTITFTLYQKLGDNQATVYTPYGSGGKGTVTYTPASDSVPASWSTEKINNLPKYVYDTTSGEWITASYYVVEVDPTGMTISYKIGEGDAKSSGDEAIVGPADTDRTITIINTDNLVNLDIVKVDSNDPNKKLTGAKFQMRKQNGSMWEAFENKAFSVDKDKETGPFEITSEVGITISNLAPGTYQVTEIDAPDGYIVSNNVFTFTVSDAGVVSYDENSNDLITFTAAKVGENAQFQVANVAGTQLPQTGGIGTTLFTALGVLMTGTAGAILTMKSYRRRKQNA